jgi:hypothetical protein
MFCSLGVHRTHAYHDCSASTIDTAPFCIMAEVTPMSKGLLCHTNNGLGHGMAQTVPLVGATSR